MRTLLAGIIGAAVATAAWLSLEHFMQLNLGWLVCLVGLVTGVCVHRAGGAGAGASFGRGALAIVLTLAAIAGGRQVYVKIVQAKAMPAGLLAMEKKVPGEAEGSDEQEDAASDAEEESAPVVSPVDDLNRLAAHEGQVSVAKPSLKKTFSEWDMLWMSLAALAAYVTGKGSSPATVANAMQDESSVDEDEPQ